MSNTERGSEELQGRVGHIDCPEWDCSWTSRGYSKFSEELAAKVDAAMHYVETHGGRIPESARFGDKQCPQCFDIHGLNGTVSCSECGFVPEEARWVPQEDSTHD